MLRLVLFYKLLLYWLASRTKGRRYPRRYSLSSQAESLSSHT